MLLINPNNEYPRHIGDLQLEHPDWKAGDALPDGWTEVAYATELPLIGPDEVLFEAEPSLVNGVLTQTLTTRPMTAEEIERRNAPITAKAKLIELGLTELEIEALVSGLVR